MIQHADIANCNHTEMGFLHSSCQGNKMRHNTPTLHLLETLLMPRTILPLRSGVDRPLHTYQIYCCGARSLKPGLTGYASHRNAFCGARPWRAAVGAHPIILIKQLCGDCNANCAVVATNVSNSYSQSILMRLTILILQVKPRGSGR